ncbi:NUDIX domain-containing protein [Methylobacter sp. BlB1]|uniref:NUDIX hydrolase n=1 Tax=Methylobacter sp. BlB1 TaxID=2785914 RepID=UPI0018930BA8|nr:NUDIX domain-containing protein [Methylobacter sp. BlB1]MBF6649061.1 NUDIX hydrolase [Methylobacter sp. BlB1]
MTSSIIQTIDVVLLTIKNSTLHVALLKRENPPFQDHYALPGGYVHEQEDNDCLDSALRVLKTKMGIRPPYLEQLETFSGKYRDPRGWSVSVVYFALVPLEVIEAANTPLASLADIDDMKELPFDHAKIIRATVSRIRNKAQYSSLPCFLAGETFTLPALQKIYEICLNEKLNKVSFRRKIAEMDVIEEVTGQLSRQGAYRPAKIYKLKSPYLDKLKTLESGL